MQTISKGKKKKKKKKREHAMFGNKLKPRKLCELIDHLYIANLAFLKKNICVSDFR